MNATMQALFKKAQQEVRSEEEIRGVAYQNFDQEVVVKFAELLEKEFEAKYFSAGYLAGKSDGIIETVRECMTICEDVTERNDPTIACYYAIKEHFGVEQ